MSSHGFTAKPFKLLIIAMSIVEKCSSLLEQFLSEHQSYDSSTHNTLEWVCVVHTLELWDCYNINFLLLKFLSKMHIMCRDRFILLKKL